MKNNVIRIITLVAVIFITAMITNICYGANIIISAGSTELTVGSVTTLTISGTDIIGKISITSSNPDVISLSSSEEWLEGVVTVNATAKSAGSSYITVTSVDTSSASTGEAVSAAAGANITAKEIVNITETREEPKTTQTQQNATIEDTRSSNNYLSSLSVEGYELNPAFNTNTNNYTMNVKSDVSELKLSAIPADNNARVTIDGNLDLVSGENNVTIAVTAENGYRRVYTIVVTKEKDPNDEDASIAKLTINNAKIKGEFSPELLEYMCDDISADISKLDIVIETKVSDLKYEIIGNDELKTGINHITIKVTSRDGTQTKEYNIIVYKTEELLALKDIEEPVQEEIPSMLDKMLSHKKAIIGVCIGLLIVIIAVVAFIVIKKKKANYSDPNEGWLKSDDEAYENKVNEYVNEENEKQNEIEEESKEDNIDEYDNNIEESTKEDSFEDEEQIEEEELPNNLGYNSFDDGFILGIKEEEVNNALDEQVDINVENENKAQNLVEEKEHKINLKLDLSSLKDDNNRY